MLKNSSLFIKRRNIYSLGLYFLISGISLTACFETGLNQGSNKVLLNGSVLKGTVSYANVALVDRQGQVIWKGVTDSQGRFSAEYTPSSEGVLTLIARMSSDSSMQCDAINCRTKDSSKKYSFGQFIPANELATTVLKSTIHVSDANNASASANSYAQINGLSTMVADLISQQAGHKFSAQQYRQLAKSSSAIVAASFGMDTNELGDILKLKLHDINQPNSFGQQSSTNETESRIATLALLNAGQASNIDYLNQFSDAIKAFVTAQESVQDDLSAKTKLEKIQQHLLLAAQQIVDSEKVKVNSEQVKQNIQHLLEEGVNYTGLLKAVNEFLIVSGKKPAHFEASSTYWDASVEHYGSQYVGQWWWVSSFISGKEESLQVEFGQPFSAKLIEIGLNNSFKDTNGKIEGSDDGETWIPLADTINAEESVEFIDERNVRHISFDLDLVGKYRHYRYLSEASSAVWLEYLCFYQTKPPGTLTPCQYSEIPVATITSSLRLAPKNVGNAAPNSWWLSDLASGDPEWLKLSYQQPFVAKKATMIVKQTNQGVSPTLEGSNDGENWEKLAEIEQEESLEEHIDERGFRHFSLTLDNDKPFQYYRFYSKPSSFVWIEYLRFQE